MGQLMAALVKYADSDSTKDPESDDEKAGKGNKNGNAKGSQHNLAIKGATTNVRLVVALSLWLIPMHWATISDVGEGHFLGLVGQVTLLSSC